MTTELRNRSWTLGSILRAPVSKNLKKGKNVIISVIYESENHAPETLGCVLKAPGHKAP